MSEYEKKLLLQGGRLALPYSNGTTAKTPVRNSQSMLTAQPLPPHVMCIIYEKQLLL